MYHMYHIDMCMRVQWGLVDNPNGDYQWLGKDIDFFKILLKFSYH